MIKKITLVLFLFISALISTAQTTLTVAENFIIKTPDGEPVNLFNILDGGQYVVIDFFNVTCGPCQTYAPDVQMSFETFGSNQQEVFFMGISYSGNNAMLIEWDQTYGITMPTISGTEGGGYNVHINYGIQTVPTIVLIAPNKDILGQLHIPAYVPETSVIDSMLIAHGLIPAITGNSNLTINSGEFSFYPNPVVGQVQISVQLHPGKDYRLEIYSMSGHLMVKKNLQGIGLVKEDLNIDNLEQGLYLATLIENNRIVGRKKLNVIR
ncbi:MAG: T9SS type A sorting domain-containing protein [Bacteroidales bacterium]|nr:T9SS type A sorting domain-containing protein [Bacteroidales bacterium]